MSAHGTRSGYLHGCKCLLCRAANADYCRWRSENPGTVPADPVRAHLRTLSAAGIGRRQVAKVSGVAYSAVWDVWRGETKRVRLATAEALLAVTVEDHAPNGPVDAQDTWRIVRELTASGVRKGAIAMQALGSARPALQLGKTHVAARNARAIQAFHDAIFHENSDRGARLRAACQCRGSANPKKGRRAC